MPLDPSAITAGYNVGSQVGSKYGALNDSLSTLVNFLVQQKQMKDKMASESQMKMRDAAISSGRATLSPEQVTAMGLTPTPPFVPPAGSYPKGYSVDSSGVGTTQYEMPTPESIAKRTEDAATLAKTQEETLRLRAGAKPGVSTEDAISNTLPHKSWNPTTWMTPNPTSQQIQDQRAKLAGGGVAAQSPGSANQTNIPTFSSEGEAEASGYKGLVIINGKKAIIH